jgi:GAF domain-containing protein
MGRGVCGAAAEQMMTLSVPDVHDFDGHIVCDLASRSEIVVPLISDGRLLGVFDIDSPQLARFSNLDQEGVESLCELFIRSLKRKNGTAIEFI